MEYKKTISPKGILGKIILAAVVIVGLYFIFTILFFGILIIGSLILLLGILQIFRKKPKPNFIEITAKTEDFEQAPAIWGPCNGQRPIGGSIDVCRGDVFRCHKCGLVGCSQENCSKIGFENGVCLRCKTPLS